MALTARAFHSLTSKFCSVTLKTTASTIHGSNATLFTDCTLGTPEIPKRPLTPFFAFAQDERSNILAGNSSMKITEVMKIASQRFKALSDGEKQKYAEITKNQNAIYKTQMDELKNSEEGKQLLEDIRKTKIEKKIKSLKMKIKAAKKMNGYPKKPLSSYVNFIQNEYDKTNPSLKASERFAAAAAAWKNTSEAEKQKFIVTEASKEDYKKDLQTWKEQNSDQVEKINAMTLQMDNLKKKLNPKAATAPKKKTVKKVAKKKVVKPKKKVVKPKKRTEKPRKAKAA